MPRICAIHQPNFFPWLGYFDKIRRADVFVFLDQVDYPKSGNSMGSWCNRVRINVSGQAKWLSCPVVREHGPQPIDTVRIDHSRPWQDDVRKTLEINYKKAPKFAAAFQVIDTLLRFEAERLADFNVHAIDVLAASMGITTPCVRQSSLPAVEERSTERLIAICRLVHAGTYLCGGGAGGYQDDATFEHAGVQLVYQNFQPEPYGNPARFLPGLSVIDWLMHKGPDA